VGTRADFYVGRGEHAEWIGSIGWDGYPPGIDAPVFASEDADTYRIRVEEFLRNNEGIFPNEGWPWPWDTSHTTDYAYAFDGGKVYGSCFGGEWFDPTHEPEDHPNGKSAVFPNMSKRKNVQMGPRSGAIIVSG
jgi:hypothetical protein